MKIFLPVKLVTSGFLFLFFLLFFFFFTEDPCTADPITFIFVSFYLQAIKTRKSLVLKVDSHNFTVITALHAPIL